MCPVSHVYLSVVGVPKSIANLYGGAMTATVNDLRETRS